MLRRVVGDSMQPALQPGDVIWYLPIKVRSGDVVVALQSGREVIKRVAKIDENGYFLVGDNMTKSTDSRKHGSVNRQNILGRVVARLPRAVAPVKARTRLADYLSYLLAIILVLLSLASLSRIDQLQPAIDTVLPGGQVATGWVTIIILLSQLFAVPYLLRLKLSLLAHAVGGVLSVLAPLIWCLLAIWGIGQSTSFGLLAGYFNLTATWWLVTLLVLWLAASYVNLYYRNYELQVSGLAKPA